MQTIVFDGKFLTRRLTGVQRFAYEVLRGLCSMEDLHIILALPKGAKEPDFEATNLEIVHFGRFKNNLWEQISLPRYCKKRKLPLFCPANSAPVFYPSNVVLHDVSYREKETYAPNILWTLKMRLLVRSYIYKCHIVYTVSEFSKLRIMEFYPKLKREPVSVGNGYEHILPIAPDDSLSLRIKDDFYFSLGSVHPNKNFRYILELAKQNPQKTFVVAGNLSQFKKEIDNAGIENCIFTGYLSDGQIKWLYEKCEGFILPSLYEGFGIPPLEAVACGCRKLFLSDIPVFREIYGDVANFFDPKDYEHPVSLEAEKMQEESALKLLDRFTWKNAAQKIVFTLFHDSMER